MNVSCPQCNHAYKLDESRVPENGQRMRCPKCSCTFRVHRGGQITDVASASIAPSTPSRPSVAPRRPERKLRPSGLSEPPHGPSPLDDPDLPTPATSAGLPAPKAKPSPLDELDLPTPATSAGLPAPKVARGSFDDFDLPTPATSAGLPAPKAKPSPLDELDLARPSFAAEIPAPDPNDPFGDLGLASAKPKSSGGVAAPMSPAYEDPFGDLDLPTPASAGLPAPKHVDAFGEVDLPTPSDAMGLPTPSRAVDLPAPSRAMDLPAPSAAEHLPQPKYEDPFGDIDLRSMSDPPPKPASEVSPAAMGFSPPAAAPRRASAAPAAKRDDRRQRVQSSGSTDYGEIDLGGGPDDHGSNEFDEFPISHGAREQDLGAPRESGLNIDLAANPREHLNRGAFVDEAPSEGPVTDAKGRKSAKFEGRRRYERQSRRVKILSLGLLGIALAAGGALAFTDLGPFGVNAIASLLPNATESKTVDQLVKSIGKRMQVDTSASLTEAIRELDTALREHPDSEDLKLLGVFLYNVRDFRFGHEEAQIKKATALLGRIDLETSESRFAPLARASRDIFSMQAKRAADLLSKIPNASAEQLALLCEAQLADGDGQKALATAKKVTAKEKSARSSYLLIRALELVGKRDEALAALEKHLVEHPRHNGGKFSLARLLLGGDRSSLQRIGDLLAPVAEDAASNAEEKARAFALMGRAALRGRNPRAASALFDKATALAPEDIDLLVGRGFLALDSGDAQGATLFFVKARGEDEKNVDAKVGHADAMLRLNMVGEAKSLATEALAARPDDALGHFLLGRIAFSLKSYDEAERELLAAIASDKGLVEAYVALADIYSKTGRDAEATSALEKAGEEAKGSSIVKRTIADAYASRGDYATAIVALNDALDIDPNDIGTHFRMAQLYRKLGSATDAEQALSEVSTRDPKYPGVALEQGLLLESQGRLQEALAAYERALEATPADPGAKLRVGAASMALGDYGKAEPLLSDAVAAMPDSAEANFSMGELFRRTDRPVDASTYLRRAIERDDANALYHLRMGMAFMAMHDTKKALEETERARALDADLAEAHLRVGEIKLRTGEARDAIELFSEALKRDPKLAEAYGLIGEAFEELAQLGNALKYYQMAVRELPDDANFNFKLGVTALQVTGPRSAVAPLTKAVSLADVAGSEAPPWLPEALYRLGVVQQNSGERAAAVATFKRYLEVAPERAIDRSEVESRLEQMGAAR